MKVLGVDNVLLAVGDLLQAIDFYHDALGLPVKFRFDEAGIAAFGLGEEEPGLLVRAQGAPLAPPVPSPRVWLEVPDAREAFESLGGRGVKALAPAFEVHTGWAFEVADPWGNVVGFTDYTKDPAGARPSHR